MSCETQVINSLRANRIDIETSWPVPCVSTDAKMEKFTLPFDHRTHYPQ